MDFSVIHSFSHFSKSVVRRLATIQSTNHLHIAGLGFINGRANALLAERRGSPMGVCEFIPLVSRRATAKSRGGV